jgi:hypothetical protein
VTSTPIEAMGPEPFRFTPAQGPSVEGPAFSRSFKALAIAMVLAMSLWMITLQARGLVAGSAHSVLVWFMAALAMLLYMAFWIARSRTRIDGQTISQTWFAPKQVAIGELASAHLTWIRGLEWLVAPRLRVRTLASKLVVFHAADPRMLAEFERLARELEAFRRR